MLKNVKNTTRALLGLISGLLSVMLSAGADATPDTYSRDNDSYPRENTYSNTYSNAYSGDWYLGINGDLTWVRHSDMGGGGNINLGYFLAPGLSLEGEAGYHEASGKDGYGSTHYFTYMGNLYYDFNQLAYAPPNSAWRIAPYIGGGIGAATVNVGSGGFIHTFHHHDTDFAYEGMAGLSFISSSAPNAEWTLGYRYTGTDSGDDNINANNIELGLKVHF